MLEHEDEARAIDAARNRMPKRFQRATTHEIVETTERLNRIEAFLIDRFGYDHNDAEQVLKNQETVTFDKYLGEEEAKILERKEQYIKFRDASFKIFIEVFAPFVYGERLKWSDKVPDDKTGHKSSTMETLLRETHPAIADILALNNPEAFKEAIANKYNEHAFIWEWDRWSLKHGKDDYPFDRYFAVSIRLKIVNR